MTTELWTVDRRLFDAISPIAPWLRWLGDYAAALGRIWPNQAEDAAP